MSKTSKIIAVVAVVAVVVLFFVSKYNSMVSMDEAVITQWANVENAYKRRADLVPNLVNTVKGYAKHEQGTFEAVVNARAKATQITVDPTNLTPEKMKEFQAAQGELQSALGRLLAVQENYPDLKANENFLQLQSQLEGTENRIATERGRYNEACNQYNRTIRSFPNNLVSGIFGFERHEPFSATEQEKATPVVSFD